MIELFPGRDPLVFVEHGLLSALQLRSIPVSPRIPSVLIRKLLHQLRVV